MFILYLFVSSGASPSLIPSGESRHANGHMEKSISIPYNYLIWVLGNYRVDLTRISHESMLLFDA